MMKDENTSRFRTSTFPCAYGKTRVECRRFAGSVRGTGRAAALLACVCGLLFVLTLPACVPITKQEKIPDGSEMPGAENSFEKEIKLGDQILETVREKDYPAFSKLLEGRCATEISKKDFENSYGNLEKQFGSIISWRYLTNLKTPLVKNMIWVVRFERKDEKKIVVQEMLFRLVTGSIDGKTCVMGLGFF